MKLTKVVLCNENEITESSNNVWDRNGLQTNQRKSQIKEIGESRNNGNRNHNTTIECEEIRSSQSHSTANSVCGSLDGPVGSPAHESSVLPTYTACPPPLFRKFWKSGNYEVGQIPNLNTENQNLKNHMCVHPMFLHSNATSHKWAFGAFAELLDNVVDEIQNGATFVYVDKIVNPRDRSPALLIQDDGGGMDPEVIRHCMSFGFSDKSKKCVIGQYGNGFKTSSMRLGADVIVFSRHMKESMMTQSIGLLSFSLLTRMGYDRIVVPMVDYEFSPSTESFHPILTQGKEYFSSNLSVMLEWSPYKTEEEMLKQFDDIGNNGTKIIIYNLWLNDDGEMELDFDSDPKDIHITGDPNLFRAAGWKQSNAEHIAYRYQYSLRAYLSILYLRLPESFNIFLRGQVVQHHNIADDLKFPEFVLYRPFTGGAVDAAVVTTIGFLKEAPDINVHGFNIYCRNRLILPFWQTLRIPRSKGRGVVGILEANYIEPTHNKQDFEKTSLFQKLEDRLKQMALEYWHLHCELIGYQSTGKKPVGLPSRYSRSSCPAFESGQDHEPITPVSNESSTKNPVLNGNKSEKAKRKEYDPSAEVGQVKRHEGSSSKTNDNQFRVEQPDGNIKHHIYDQEKIKVLKVNKELRSRLIEYDKNETELTLKVEQLKGELKEVDSHYMNLLAEWNSVKMDLES